MAITTDVEAVAWDLEDLLPAEGEAGVDQLLDEIDAIAADIESARGTVAGLDADGLVSLLGKFADLYDHIGRVGNYVGLKFSVDTSDPKIASQMQRVEERSTVVATRLLFFDLEWAALDDAKVDELLVDERLGFARHHLRSLRRYRPHLLSEAEEVVLTEKSVTGASAWGRLFDEQTSAIEVDLEGETMSLEIALAALGNPDQAARRTAALAVSEALEPGLRTRAFIYNTLLADKSTDDRLRKYPSWVSSRNLSNEASDESVASLVEAVTNRTSIAQRWYTAKAEILGLDGLDDWDRYATVATDEAEFDWAEGCEIVLDAYGSFSTEMADVVRQFLAEPWIDAPVRPAKRGGA